MLGRLRRSRRQRVLAIWPARHPALLFPMRLVVSVEV